MHNWIEWFLGIERRKLREQIAHLRKLEQAWEDASEFGHMEDVRKTRDEFAHAASSFVRRWSRIL